MSLFRSSPMLSLVARRTAPAGIRQSLAIRNFSSSPNRSSTQGYGDGEGDPRGADPQNQGKSNKTKENAEHPGPEPVKEGQGSGGGPTKGGSSGKTPEDASAQSGGSRSKEATEKGSSPTGGAVGGGGKKSHVDDSSSNSESKNGAQPKISDRKEPGVDSVEKQMEVDQHNKEFENRYDRAQPAAKDKVDKRFWSGKGGADEQA